MAVGSQSAGALKQGLLGLQPQQHPPHILPVPIGDHHVLAHDRASAQRALQRPGVEQRDTPRGVGREFRRLRLIAFPAPSSAIGSGLLAQGIGVCRWLPLISLCTRGPVIRLPLSARDGHHNRGERRRVSARVDARHRVGNGARIVRILRSP